MSNIAWSLRVVVGAGISTWDSMEGVKKEKELKALSENTPLPPTRRSREDKKATYARRHAHVSFCIGISAGGKDGGSGSCKTWINLCSRKHAVPTPSSIFDNCRSICLVWFNRGHLFRYYIYLQSRRKGNVSIKTWITDHKQFQTFNYIQLFIFEFVQHLPV
jgi:hypothetical protein